MDSLRSLLGSPELLFAVTLTAKTCAAAGAGFILFAPLLALLFSRRSAFWVRALSFVVTLPLVFPPVALGYLLLLLFGAGFWMRQDSPLSSQRMRCFSPPSLPAFPSWCVPLRPRFRANA